jgi:hypothetical protein
MNEADNKSSLPSSGKCSLRYRCFAWALIIVAISAIILLLLYLPIVVEIVLVCAALFAAIAIWRYEGFGKGLKFFVKEILFGL